MTSAVRRAMRLRFLDAVRRRAVDERGTDGSRSVGLLEAYWPGAPHRLTVLVGDERAYLSLTGARHLQWRLGEAIRRLKARRPPPYRPKPWCRECGDDAPSGLCDTCSRAREDWQHVAETNSA